MNEQRAFTPSPEQIAEWRDAAELAFPKLLRKHYPHLHTAQQSKGATFKYIDMATEGVWQSFEIGYLRRCTEQATEIAELKAKLAEVMPLAKFGAEVLDEALSFNAIDISDVCLFASKRDLLKDDGKVTDVADATITKILGD
jgi:hypothetical protein